MDIFGVIVLSAGIFNKIACRKIAVENLSKFGKNGDTIYDAFTIDQKINIFEKIEIHEPKIEINDPIYVGSQHLKVPIGGGSRTVYKKIFNHVIHNLPNVDMTECTFVGNMNETMKTYEFHDLKEKLKRKHNISISRLRITAPMLRLYTSTNINVLFLIGAWNNGIFVAKYGGMCKNEVFNCADRGKNWSIVIIGIILIIIGCVIRMASDDTEILGFSNDDDDVIHDDDDDDVIHDDFDIEYQYSQSGRYFRAVLK